MTAIYKAAGGVYSFPFLVTNTLGQAADWDVEGTLILRSDDLPQVTPATAYSFRRDGLGRYTALLDSSHADLLAAVDADCFDDGKVLTVDLIDFEADSVDLLAAMLPRTYIVGDPRPSLDEIEAVVGSGYTGSGPLRLNVVVKRALDGLVLEGASVRAILSGVDSALLQTDDTGRVQFTLLEALTWAILVWHGGYIGYTEYPYAVESDLQELEILLDMSSPFPPDPGLVTAYALLRVNGVPTEGEKMQRLYVGGGPDGYSDSQYPEVQLSVAGGIVSFTNLYPGTTHLFWRGNNRDDAVELTIPNDGSTEVLIPETGG